MSYSFNYPPEKKLVGKLKGETSWPFLGRILKNTINKFIVFFLCAKKINNGGWTCSLFSSIHETILREKINLFFLYFFQVFLLSMIEVISINFDVKYIFMCIQNNMFMISRVLCTLYSVHLCVRNILCIDIIIYSDNFDFF